MESSVKNDNLSGEEARELLEYLESTRPRCFSGDARFNTFQRLGQSHNEYPQKSSEMTVQSKRHVLVSALMLRCEWF